VGEGIADVAVGGGGRYLILYRPTAQVLDVFDVNVARVVGHIPVSETRVHFAAGQSCVVVVLPRAKTIERWSPILPGPDGKNLFTDAGRFSTDTVPQATPQGRQMMIPACHDDYYLTIPWVSLTQPGRNRPGTPTVHRLSRTTPIATLAQLERVPAMTSQAQDDFLSDKRYYLVPVARLVITIPYTNDRLILHRFEG
jgi:hypothetical protein